MSEGDGVRVRSARGETIVHALDHLGWCAFFDDQIKDDERSRWSAARVVWQGRQRYRLSTGDAESDAALAGRVRHRATSSADLPAVGDWVLAVLRPTEGTATIHRRLDRRSTFSRAAAGRSTDAQVIAANVDTVLLVSSFNRDFNPRRIERYLALIWESGASAVVVLNKADLCVDPAAWREQIASVAQGVPILVTSAISGDGIVCLRELVRTSGTSAVVGSSGVGKSTLINLLLGRNEQEVLPVLPICRTDDRGRHTTTTRQLFCLPGGGILIDTPGLRELALWDAEAGVDHAFGEISALSADCRFRDCTHAGEPGCAVTAAVERGDVSPERLESYRRLQREDEYVRARHDERVQSERTRKAKHFAKAAKLLYKLRRR